MKNVLFTTTAVAALAFGGTAFAAGHSSGNFGISGSTDVGYNDDIEGGIFQETNIDVKASKDAGAGYTVGGHARLNLDWREGAGQEKASSADLVEFKNVYVETPVGKLEFADSYDGTGASDRFYKDRDGMAEDMTNGDGHAGLMWTGDVGAFGYAIDMGNIEAGSTVNMGDHYTVGLGGEVGPATFGLGWENNSHEGAGSVVGVSGDFELGVVGLGLSYITSDVEDSIGVAASAEVIPGVTVGAYYASNDPSDDAYGVTFDYENGPFTLAIDYNTGDGATVDELEIDASYDMGNGVVLYAGNSDAAGEGYYVGAQIDIADGVSATIAYAEADEIGGPEFKDGTSAYLSLSY